MPTGLYKDEFAKRGLAPENLSRAVFNFVSPLLTLLLGITGWRIACLPNGGHVADKPL